MKPTITTFSFLILLILFLYICGIGIKNIFRYNTFKSEYSFLFHKKDSVLASNRYYQQLLDHLENDSTWEMEAKKKLGLSKKNEVVYAIIRN